MYLGSIMFPFSLCSPMRPPGALLIFLLPPTNLFWGIACILSHPHKGRISRFPPGKQYCKSQLDFQSSPLSGILQSLISLVSAFLRCLLHDFYILSKYSSCFWWKHQSALFKSLPKHVGVTLSCLCPSIQAL